MIVRRRPCLLYIYTALNVQVKNTFSRNRIFRLALNFQYIGNQSEQRILQIKFDTNIGLCAGKVKLNVFAAICE